MTIYTMILQMNPNSLWVKMMLNPLHRPHCLSSRTSVEKGRAVGRMQGLIEKNLEKVGSLIVESGPWVHALSDKPHYLHHKRRNEECVTVLKQTLNANGFKRRRRIGYYRYNSISVSVAHKW